MPRTWVGNDDGGEGGPAAHCCNGCDGEAACGTVRSDMKETRCGRSARRVPERMGVRRNLVAATVEGAHENKVIKPYWNSMARTLAVTAKKQVTLRRELLGHLGVRPGDRIVVDLLPSGRVELRAASSDLSPLGIFGLPGRSGQIGFCCRLKAICCSLNRNCFIGQPPRLPPGQTRGLFSVKTVQFSGSRSPHNCAPNWYPMVVSPVVV